MQTIEKVAELEALTPTVGPVREFQLQPRGGKQPRFATFPGPAPKHYPKLWIPKFRPIGERKKILLGQHLNFEFFPRVLCEEGSGLPVHQIIL